MDLIRRGQFRFSVRTLTELREWNEKNEKLGTLKYGQGLLDFSDAMLERARRKSSEIEWVEGMITYVGRQDNVNVREAAFAAYGVSLLADGVASANSELTDGYPEFTMKMLQEQICYPKQVLLIFLKTMLVLGLKYKKSSLPTEMHMIILVIQ